MLLQFDSTAEELNTLFHEAKGFSIRPAAVAEILRYEADRCGLPDFCRASATELAGAAHDLNEIRDNSIDLVGQQAEALSESEMNHLFAQLLAQVINACETAQRGEVSFRRLDTKQYGDCLPVDFANSIEWLRKFTQEFRDWLSIYSATDLK